MGVVRLFTDDGELIEDATIQRTAFPTALQWHPTLKLLATGWSNGEVIVWNDATRSVLESKSLHDKEVVFLEWSKDGSTLLSGGKEGRIGAWAPAKNGKLTLVQDFKQKAELVACVVRDAEVRRKKGGEG